MKSFSNISYYIILLLMLSRCASPLKTGIKKYEMGEYQSAVNFFSNSLEIDPNQSQAGKINFLIAESLRLSNRIREALPYYQKAEELSYYTDQSQFHYGFSLKANGQYEKAEQQFNNYLREGTDAVLVNRAKEELANLKKIQQLSIPNKWIEITNCTDINTEESEYGPIPINKSELIFSSSQASDEVYKGNGLGYLDLLHFEYTNIDDCKGRITPLGSPVNTPDRHEASATLSRDGNVMIFARSNIKSGDNSQKAVDLYITFRKGDNWTEPKLLDISNPKYWDSTPALSPDGTRLYFASNRPGGYGGIDLWVASLTEQGWGKVRNLGKTINTSGDELFPYVAENKNLYFASDGHPGLGGLDIFEAVRRDGKINIKNLGAPLNTNFDDFSFVLTGHKKALFSSNRPTDGGKGNDDIFIYTDNTPSIQEIDFYLAGKTYLNKNDTLTLLPNTTVSLLDPEGQLLEKTLSDENGAYKFALKLTPFQSYKVIGEKAEHIKHEEDFYCDAELIKTKKLDKSIKSFTFEQDLKLYQDIFKLETPGIEVVDLYILYDFDKWDIRPDAAKILDQLVEYLKQNNLRIELGSHTDDRGSNNYNMKLSKKRAESAVNYLILHGISQDRVLAKGYGETDPKVTPAYTEEDHQENRRTTVKVLYDYDE